VLLHGDHVSAHDAGPALRGKQAPPRSQRDARVRSPLAIDCPSPASTASDDPVPSVAPEPTALRADRLPLAARPNDRQAALLPRTVGQRYLEAMGLSRPLARGTRGSRLCYPSPSEATPTSRKVGVPASTLRKGLSPSVIRWFSCCTIKLWAIACSALSVGTGMPALAYS